MPRITCCVPGCSVTKHDGVPLHRFPNFVVNPELFMTWIFHIGGSIHELDKTFVYNNLRVCQKHFRVVYLYPNSRLCKLAVPELLMPGHDQQIIEENVPPTPFTFTPIAETLLPSTSVAPHHSECAVTGAGVMRIQLEHNYSGHNQQETEAHFPFISTPFVETLLPSTSVAPHHSECAVTGAGVMRIQLEHNYSGHDQQIIEENVPPTPFTFTPIAETLLPSTSVAPHHSECAVTGAGVMRIQSEHNYSAKLMKVKGNKQTGRLFIKTKQSSSLLKKIVVLRNKLKSQKDQVKAAHKMSRTILFRKVLKSLPVTTQTFINMQLTQHGKKNRGRRFNLDDKLLALSMYKKSPKGYNFLRKLFTLPSKRTLQNVLKLTTIKPGINPALFSQLKDATDGLATEKRLCVLMFDEMSLAPSMHYSNSLDEIVGFENLGVNDITDNIADHALVMMIKGIHAKWKQPIFYGFCKNATKAVVLKKIIKQVIVELFEVGLIVVATVCDQSRINVKVVNELIAETKAEYLRANKEFRYNAFEISDRKIFPLYDAPHLLKGIRNNLMSKNLRFIQDGKVKTAKWEHLKLLLDVDGGEDELRMCNKLTEAHVLPEKLPKMKVKHAAQVFSQRVSGALRFCAKNHLLPEECSDTADLLLFFDQLFDSFNGGSYKQTHKIYKNCVN